MKDGLLSLGRGPHSTTSPHAPIAKVEDEFDPRAFPNCRLWLDGSYFPAVWQDVGMTTHPAGKNAPIGRVNDRSGNGNDAQQPVFATRPTQNQSGQNGRLGIAFATPQFMGLGPFDGNAPFTIFAVLTITNSANFKFLIAGEANGMVLYFAPDGYHMLAKNGVGNLLTSTNPAPIGTAFLVTVTYDGTTTTMRKNGAANGSGTSALVPTGNVIQLGSVDYGTNTFEGTVYEVRWYGAVLTAEQIAAHENDLNRKWGIY